MNISAQAQTAHDRIIALKNPSDIDILQEIQAAINSALENPQRENAGLVKELKTLTTTLTEERKQHADVLSELQKEILTLRNGV